MMLDKNIERKTYIHNENSKRILKNTAILYFRMLLTMLISLYIARFVLNTLGIKDFGIYNITSGIIILFSFLNNAMSSATIRFLNFELGKGDNDKVKRVFSMSVTAHISIAILVIIFGETIGLWFLNSQLNIPEDRMIAANWVYQFSIGTFIVAILQVPYNASIVASEEMSFYAYISIIEVSLKILVVLLLQYLIFDKLKLYSILIFCVSLIIIAIYKIHCKKKFYFASIIFSGMHYFISK